MRHGKVQITCFVYILTCILIYSHAFDLDPSKICPPKEIIEPCSCHKNCQSCNASIQCRNIYDLAVLSRVLYESSEYQHFSFELKQSSIMYLPGDLLFEARSIRHLDIDESSMVSLFYPKPTVTPRITHLYLSYVRLLRGMQWDLLSGFTDLKRLSLFRTLVRKIGRSFIEHAPKSLEEVDMYKCSTTSIHDEGFASLPKLLEVAVMSAGIKELKRSMFPKPSKLKVFDFSRNRLSSLPEDIFSAMPDLWIVYLNGNALKQMPESIAPAFPNLLVLDFDDNPLECRCNIRWITVKSLDPDPRQIDGTCHGPKNLQGTRIRDLVADDFSHC